MHPLVGAKTPHCLQVYCWFEKAALEYLCSLKQSLAPPREARLYVGTRLFSKSVPIAGTRTESKDRILNEHR
jgi:hypothetical protein